MFLTETLRALNLYKNDIVQYCKNALVPSYEKARLRTQSVPTSYARALGPTILTTLLTMPNMRFRINSMRLSRSNTRSTTLESMPLKHHLNETEERAQAYNILRWLTNYIVQIENPDTNTCCMFVFQTSCGFQNIKKWLKQAGYEPINIDALKTRNSETIEDLKVDVYKILNNVIIITNQNENINYEALAGWLPIFFKEAYKDLKLYPDLYDFYKTSYRDATASNETIKQHHCIKELIKNARNKKFSGFLNNLESTLIQNVDRKINELRATIADSERMLQNYYTRLATVMCQKAKGNTIVDKDLITKCLINNPNVENALLIDNNQFEITTAGPVEYDQKAIKSTLKHKSSFVIWLFTNPDYTLYWESICVVDTHRNEIKAVQNTSSPNYQLRNTHWHRYNCFGNNRTPIIKALTQHDYLSAFSQIITAAQLLNPYDVTVVNALIEELTYNRPSYKAFINNKTKTLLSTNEMAKIFDSIQKVGGTENAQ